MPTILFAASYTIRASRSVPIPARVVPTSNRSGRSRAFIVLSQVRLLRQKLSLPQNSQIDHRYEANAVSVPKSEWLIKLNGHVEMI